MNFLSFCFIFVSYPSQTIEHRSPSGVFVTRASNVAEEDGDGGQGTAQASFWGLKSTGKTGTRSSGFNVDSKRAKEGPSPTPPSRPSLELIQDGQVRSMSKQLSFSCTEFFAPHNVSAFMVQHECCHDIVFRPHLFHFISLHLSWAKLSLVRVRPHLELEILVHVGVFFF